MAPMTSFAGRFQRLGLLLFLMVLALFFTVASPYFFTRENIVNILIQSTVPVIASVGMTIVIATAGIDLSVGSILALGLRTTQASIRRKRCTDDIGRLARR
jgi:ribose/xylose/arabinose/galactoside ABC-type transport system permease subunit